MGRVLKDIMVSPHASQNLVGDNAYDSDKLDSPPLSGSTGALCRGARFFARRLTLLSEGNDTVAARVLQEQNAFGTLKALGWSRWA